MSSEWQRVKLHTVWTLTMLKPALVDAEKAHVWDDFPPHPWEKRLPPTNDFMSATGVHHLVLCHEIILIVLSLPASIWPVQKAVEYHCVGAGLSIWNPIWFFIFMSITAYYVWSSIDDRFISKSVKQVIKKQVMYYSTSLITIREQH